MLNRYYINVLMGVILYHYFKDVLLGYLMRCNNFSLLGVNDGSHMRGIWVKM